MLNDLLCMFLCSNLQAADDFQAPPQGHVVECCMLDVNSYLKCEDDRPTFCNPDSVYILIH